MSPNYWVSDGIQQNRGGLAITKSSRSTRSSLLGYITETVSMSAATVKGKKSRKKSAKGKWSNHSIFSRQTWQSESSECEEAFDDWRAILAKRKRPSKTAKILGEPVAQATSWMIDSSSTGRSLVSRLLAGGHSKPKSSKSNAPSFAISDSEAEQWLADWGTDVSRENAELEAVAWCHLLPSAAATLTGELWVGIFTSLCELAESTELKRSLDHPPASVSPSDLWLSIELPIALAWQFPNIRRCRALAKPGATRLSASLVDLLDGEGMIYGGALDSFGQIAASWTRCLAMLKEVPGIKASKDAKGQYAWTIRNLLRMVRTDGELCFSKPARSSGKIDGKLPRDLRNMLRAGLRMTSDEEDGAIFRTRMEGKKIAKSRMPEGPSFHSEWSEFAILQPDWSRTADRLIVDFSQSTIRVELQANSHVVFSTPWNADIQVDGVRLEAIAPQSGWESVCWFSDEDSDFLELELEMTQGWSLQRQFLLGRKDNFLMICDHLVPTRRPAKSAKIDYQLAITLASEILGESPVETREGFLSHRNDSEAKFALAVPLALPEWSDDDRFGDFSIRDNALELHQVSQGRGLSAPLFFDMSMQRVSAPRTWRQLTVAETRRIIGRDEAVGFRIRVGADQWLMYRSLDEPRNRTLIGHNLNSEFLFARLTHDGEPQPLVEIE